MFATSSYKNLWGLRKRPALTPDIEAGGEPSSSSSSALSRNEYIDILARRVLYSRAYTVFYASLICAGVAEVAWILLPTSGGVGVLPTHGAFTMVECYVTVGLVLEMALHAALQRRAFWRKPENYFDALVASVSIASTVSLVSGVETRGEALVADLLVTSRVVFRLLRLLSITKSFQRQQGAADRKLDIEFDDIVDSPLLASPPYSCHVAPPGHIDVGSPAQEVNEQGQRGSLGRTRARLLRLLRALAAPDGSALPGIEAGPLGAPSHCPGCSSQSPPQSSIPPPLATQVYEQVATPDDDGVDMPCSPTLLAQTDSTRAIWTV